MAVTYNKINWDEETPITVANLDRIDVGIDEVVTQANSNESRITTNEGDISNLETEQSNQDNRITTNESDISSNEDRITTNEDDISSNEGRITANDDDIDDLLKLEVVEQDTLTFIDGFIPAGADLELTTYVSDGNWYYIKVIDNNDEGYDRDINTEVGARNDRFINVRFDYIGGSVDETVIRYKIYDIN